MIFTIVASITQTVQGDIAGRLHWIEAVRTRDARYRERLKIEYEKDGR